ncbi:uncharacterized protein LOC126248176 isoform X2 [Schistocerca nitens]|uniref:uncharacterized protein LOC126248176 isoform X2 n=1 Tax=Schistocerca nitens TaxID=7011 RepID=UPI00211857BF|nr:uncharacterized protein LOC126248176 isoform X2 [Schistocerca nitens]
MLRAKCKHLGSGGSGSNDDNEGSSGGCHDDNSGDGSSSGNSYDDGNSSDNNNASNAGSSSSSSCGGCSRSSGGERYELTLHQRQFFACISKGTLLKHLQCWQALCLPARDYVRQAYSRVCKGAPTELH